MRRSLSPGQVAAEPPHTPPNTGTNQSSGKRGNKVNIPPLTSSFFSTLLHPHLLPQRVNGYQIDGTHARVHPRVCAHVDQPAGFHTGRQDGLSWGGTETSRLQGWFWFLFFLKLQTSTASSASSEGSNLSRECWSSYLSVFKCVTKLIKGERERGTGRSCTH